MAVITVPHIPTPPPEYDGPHGFPRRQSAPVVKTKQPRHPLPPKPQPAVVSKTQPSGVAKPAAARKKPLIVDGSKTSPVQGEPASPVVDDFSKALVAAISAKLCASEPATPATVTAPVPVAQAPEPAPARIPILAPVPVHLPAKPVVAQAPVQQKQGPVKQQQGPVKPAKESNKVFIALDRLPADNKLNNIRLRANYTASPDKPKLIAAAKAIIVTALHAFPATKTVQLGSWFFWSERGLNFNFATDEQRWLATDDQSWLQSIGENLRIHEKWGAITICRLWNPYILSHTRFDSSFLRRLESLNPFETTIVNADGAEEVVVQEYRVRRIRWLAPGLMAVWFHDGLVAEHFLEKHIIFMDGLVGRPPKMGICALRSVWPFLDRPRRAPGAENPMPRKVGGQYNGAGQFVGGPQTPASGKENGHGQRNGCVDCGTRGGYSQVYRQKWQQFQKS
ncbi:hypothetical protein ABW21_db0202113 [Orbilia brochopaga]|nr:hypothetical protein ABW21_db0202113 [Drechslerella brochopaga]